MFRNNYITKSLFALSNVPEDATGDRFLGNIDGGEKWPGKLNLATIWWKVSNGVKEYTFQIDKDFQEALQANVIIKDGFAYLYRYEWTHYFKKIFLINLPERTGKLQTASEELNRYSIPFEVFPAIKHPNGKYGIFLTMQKLLGECAGAPHPILCFEDDILFVRDPGPIMDRCVPQLQSTDWDLFYMGPNTHHNFGELYDRNLLLLREAFARHATAYSMVGMQKVLALNWEGHSLDIMIRGQIQPGGKCFCSWPFLATQRNGFSDIDNKEVTYNYIHERFKTHTKHLPPYGNS